MKQEEEAFLADYRSVFDGPRGEVVREVARRLAGIGYRWRGDLGVPGREVTIGAARAMVVELPVTDSRLFEEDRSLEQHPA